MIQLPKRPYKNIFKIDERDNIKTQKFNEIIIHYKKRTRLYEKDTFKIKDSH